MSSATAPSIVTIYRWMMVSRFGILGAMSQVTQILNQMEAGDQQAAEKLLPLVYDELKKLAAAKMAHERADHTLQSTALVHEAYLRLIDSDTPHQWNGRGHFFGAAAEAMRRILVEHARQVRRQKRGGQQQQISLSAVEPFREYDPDELLSLNDALDELAGVDASTVELVKLRVFAGLSNTEAAAAMKMPESTAKKHWLYAKAWLRRQLSANGQHRKLLSDSDLSKT